MEYRLDPFPLSCRQPAGGSKAAGSEGRLKAALPLLSQNSSGRQTAGERAPRSLPVSVGFAQTKPTYARRRGTATFHPERTKDGSASRKKLYP